MNDADHMEVCVTPTPDEANSPAELTTQEELTGLKEAYEDCGGLLMRVTKELEALKSTHEQLKKDKESEERRYEKERKHNDNTLADYKRKHAKLLSESGKKARINHLLANNLEKLEIEKKNVTESLEKLTNEKKSISDELNLKTKSIVDLENKCSELQQNFMNFRETVVKELESTQKELELTQKERNDLLSENETMRTYIDSYENKAKEQDQLMQQWTKQSDMLYEDINSKYKELNEKTRQIEQLTTDLNHKVKENDILKEKNETLSNQLKENNAKVSESSSSISNKNREFVEEIRRLTGQLNDKNKENWNLRMDINSKHSQLETLRCDNQNLNATLIKSQQNEKLLSQQISTLKSDNKTLKEEICGKTSYIQQLINDLEAKEALLGQKEALIGDKETSIARLNCLLDQRMKDYDQVQHKLSIADAEKNNLLKSCSVKEQLIKDKDKQIVLLCKEKSALEMNWSDLQKKIRAKNEENQKLQKEISTLSVDRQRKVGLECALKGFKVFLSSELQSLKLLQDTTKSECIEFLKDNMNYMNGVKMEIEQRMTQVLNERDELQKKIDSIALRANCLHKKVSELTDVYECREKLLNGQLIQKNEEFQQSEHDRTALLSENRTNNVQLKNFGDEILTLKQKLSELMNEESKNQLLEVDRIEYEYFKERCVQYQIDVENLTGKILELENNNVSLLHEWQQKYAGAEEQIKNLTNSLVECQERLENARSAILNIKNAFGTKVDSI